MGSSKDNVDFHDLDVPPPVTEATRHGVYPDLNHDECARFNFHACLYKVIAKELSPANKLVYEKRVLPSFEKSNGRAPKSRHEVRKAMNNDPFHNFWGGMRRNTMEMRQVNGQFVVLRQLDELSERAASFNAGSGKLHLDSNVKVPAYVHEVDHHCMPGSYHRQLVKGDVSPAANYDTGFFVTTLGSIGGLCDAAGKAVADWVKTEHSEVNPKRILDIGSAVGNSIVPIAKAFPDAEVMAIDVSAPMLRYSAARAQSLGVQNIQFKQASGEDLSDFEDGSFDIVMTSIFLHELSFKSLPKIISEMYRVLKKGGLMLHLEQPQYSEDMPVFEQYMRDWDSYNNNEPFWSAMHEIDLKKALVDLGFDASNVKGTAMKSPVELTENANDYGRSPEWHAYVGVKT